MTPRVQLLIPCRSAPARLVLLLLVARVHNPPECATPIQLCIGSWSSGIGSSDVMRTLHTSARPVSRQRTIVFDPRVPATPRVPLRCVRYYDAKIRFRSTKTLCRDGSGVAHSGGLCTLASSLVLVPQSTARAPSLARASHLDFTARERKIVWQSAMKCVRCENLSL